MSQNLATDCGMSQIWLRRGVMHRKEEIFFGFLLFFVLASSRNLLSKFGDFRHFFFFLFIFASHMAGEFGIFISKRILCALDN